MKLTFLSDSCTALENLGLYENITEIYDKMAHIQANFQRIKEVALKQARNEQEKQEATEGLFGIDEIQCDLDTASDEFLFLSNGLFLPNSCCHVEVVTPEVAESNDMDWITGTPEISLEERKTYKLGEVLSDYSKLDDKYYFKFM